MIPRAKEFLSWIDRFGHQLALTTEVMAEFLVGPSEEDRIRQFVELKRSFKVLIFDENAALIAARIRSNKEFIERLKKEGKNRPAIKANINIVATAKAAGVDILYSQDKHHKKAGEQCGLKVMELPSMTDMLPYEAERKQATKDRGLFPDEEE